MSLKKKQLIAVAIIAIVAAILLIAAREYWIDRDSKPFQAIKRYMNDSKNLVAVPYEETAIRNALSEQSAAFTNKYGIGKVIYVLPGDPNLLRIVKGSEDPDSSDPYEYPGFMENAFWLKYSWVQTILDIAPKDLDRAGIYFAMSSLNTGASVQLMRINGKVNLAFIRPEHPAGAIRDVIDNANLPGELNVAATRPTTFFHELSHSLDADILVRYREAKSKKDQSLMGCSDSQQMPYPVLKATVIGEAIGDVGAALIALRETGNKDTYTYEMRPRRLVLFKDLQHATTLIADDVMAAVTPNDVLGKTDVQLTQSAIERVMRSVNRLDNDQSLSDLKQSLLTLQSYCTYSIDPKNRDRVIAAAHQAVEASIQHLIYLEALPENNELLGAHIKTLAKEIADKEMLKAYENSLSISDGKFYSTQFAAQMNFDLNVPFTHDTNKHKMREYYLRETNDRAGFEFPVRFPDSTRAKNL